MKRHRALLATLAAVAAVLSAIVVPSAQGSTSMDFACFSASATAPGAWAADDTTVFATWDTYATGYFAPFAQTAATTSDKVGKYYLTCALPAGWVITGYVLGDGSAVETAMSPSPYLVGGLPIPGVYPVIAPAPAGTG